MIGEVFDGKYRIIRLLGQGGMGSVYEAEQLTTGEHVALKCMEGTLLARSSSGVGRFQREARAMGAIDTEYIIRVIDTGTDPQSKAPYMVMELLGGEDLQHLLDRVGNLTPNTALRIAAQVCRGLEKAHEARVMHRDIKPANLFLARRGDDDIVVKILDFGIAKIKPEPNQGGPTTGLTRTGGILGSPLYMSPEQARGLSNIDYRTDIWSLGMVLYRAISGKLPHEHIEAFGDLIIAICSRAPSPIQDLTPWLRPEAAAVIHRALALDAEDRFPTATAMLEAIRPLLPDGCSLRGEMLIAAGDATRALLAPKLPIARSPDEAHRRIMRITARAGEAVDGMGTTLDAPSTTQAPSTGGSTTTAESIITTDTRDREASPAKDTGAARSRSRWITPAAAGLLLAAGFVAFRLSRASNPAESSSPSEASTNAVSAITPPPAPAESAPPPLASASSLPAPAATALPAVQRAELTVSPGASVEIEGKPAEVKGGKVVIEGPLGSTHHVRIWKGTQERTGDVIITDKGAVPEKMELEATKPRPAPAAAATAAPSAPSPPTATAKGDPLISTTYK